VEWREVSRSSSPSLSPSRFPPPPPPRPLPTERVPEARRRRRGADINRARREEARRDTMASAIPTYFAPLVVSRLDARDSRIPGTRLSRASFVATFFAVVRPLDLLSLILLLLLFVVSARIRKSHVSDTLPARFAAKLTREPACSSRRSRSSHFECVFSADRFPDRFPRCYRALRSLREFDGKNGSYRLRPLRVEATSPNVNSPQQSPIDIQNLYSYESDRMYNLRHVISSRLVFHLHDALRFTFFPNDVRILSLMTNDIELSKMSVISYSFRCSIAVERS